MKPPRLLTSLVRVLLLAAVLDAVLPAVATTFPDAISTGESGTFGSAHWYTQNMDYPAVDTYGGIVVRGNSINVGQFTIGSWSQLAPSYGLYVAGQSWFANNVGIGTTQPGQKLTIQGGHGDSQFRIFSDHFGQGINGVNTAMLSLWASEPGWTWGGVGIGNNVSNTGGVVRLTTTRGASYMRLLDNAVTLNTVDAGGGDRSALYLTNGNVGIGTSNPGSFKLAVNGSIRAKEIIVDTNWADYVFDESYNLAPLSDVEAHIKAKKHLPGIPSAAEIAEHGVSMGDMQSKLLSKIEELTLHMIEQEKQMKAMQVAHQNEIATLRQQVGELKAAVQP